MTTVSETVYNDRDNTIDLILKSDDVAIDLRTAESGINKVELVLSDSLTIDSDDYPDAFDWETSGADGKLIMQLGGCSIPAGSYKPYLVLYDEVNDDGIIWTRFRLKVYNEEETF